MCNDTGYKGRVGFYQVMPMLEPIRELILNGANTAEIKRESMRLGIKTMRQSGLTKLKEGVTSLEEVLAGNGGRRLVVSLAKENESWLTFINC